MPTKTQRESSATSLQPYLWLLVLLVIALTAVAAVAQNTNSSNTNSSGNRNTTTANANNTNTQAGSTTTSTTTSTTSNTTVATGCPDLKDVRVTNVYKGNRIGEPKDQATAQPTGTRPEVQLGDDLTLEVNNLDLLMQRAQCTTPHKQIVLFLNGRPVKNLTPFPPTDPKGQRLVFPLKRTDDARDVWAFILGAPSLSPRTTDVSVGLDGEYAADSEAKVDLKVVPTGWFIFWLLLFIALFVGFWSLARRSDVLRDSGLPPATGERKAFSLARTQAAWWFFIILLSYFLIGIITGDFSTSITGTVLVLLGISAGTVVASSAIDAGPTGAAAPPAPGAPPAVTLAQATTGRWWMDIITDRDGVSFHRFQNAVWTLVLGIIFIVQVYKVLAMPQFSETLLGLMGISAGTFLGLKLNESK
jgi:hypothetical protein